MGKEKKRAAITWWSDWTVLWILGGFVIIYFVFIPLEAHPLHWLFSVLGGVVGYGIGLFFDIGLPSVMRFIRRGSRKTILQSDKEKRGKGRNR